MCWAAPLEIMVATSVYFGFPFGFFCRTSPNTPVTSGTRTYSFFPFLGDFSPPFFLFGRRIFKDFALLGRSSNGALAALSRGDRALELTGFFTSSSFTGALLFVSCDSRDLSRLSKNVHTGALPMSAAICDAARFMSCTLDFVSRSRPSLRFWILKSDCLSSNKDNRRSLNRSSSVSLCLTLGPRFKYWSFNFFTCNQYNNFR